MPAARRLRSCSGADPALDVGPPLLAPGGALELAGGTRTADQGLGPLHLGPEAALDRRPLGQKAALALARRPGRAALGHGAHDLGVVGGELARQGAAGVLELGAQ